MQVIAAKVLECVWMENWMANVRRHHIRCEIQSQVVRYCICGCSTLIHKLIVAPSQWVIIEQRGDHRDTLLAVSSCF